MSGSVPERPPNRPAASCRDELRRSRFWCVRCQRGIASALVWGLANADGRAPRQTKAEVDKLLKDTKLDEQMKAMGQWDDWVSGRRGVAK